VRRTVRVRRRTALRPRRGARFPTFSVVMFDPNEDEAHVFATLDELLGGEEDELLETERA